MVLACFSFRKIFDKSVEIGPRFCYNMTNLYAQVQGLRIHAGRPIHEMGTSVLLIFLTERGLTAMRNRPTLLRAEQSRAEQSRAEQSRAEQSRAEQSRAEQSRAEQ